MATSNYYGITGLGSNVRFGKTGGQLSYDSGTQSFTLNQSDVSLYAGLSVRSLDVITGDISLVTGKLNINGAIIQWQQTGVLRFTGSAAVMLPVGNNSSRPAVGLVGMVRVNTQSTVGVEYFDGAQWKIIGSGNLPLTGGTMTGNIVMTSGSKVTGLPAPTSSTDAVNKEYVDSVINGLTWKTAVSVLATTNVVVNGPVSSTIGGATLSVGNRVLLTNQIDNTQNGIWIFQGVGVAMSRASDANTPTQLNGAAVFVQVGTSADTGWTQTASLTTSFGGQIWVQFTSGTAYNAGTGLTLVGNTFYANIGQGLTITGAGNGYISVNTTFGNAIQVDGSNQLGLLLETGGGLLQSATGLKIGAGLVTNSMLSGNIPNDKLLNSSIVVSDGSNAEQIALGQGLTIYGENGLITTMSSGILSISAPQASTVTAGLASFNSTNFTVADGNVVINIVDAGSY